MRCCNRIGKTRDAQLASLGVLPSEFFHDAVEDSNDHKSASFGVSLDVPIEGSQDVTSTYSPPESEEVSASSITRIWTSSAREKIGSRLLILSNTHKANLTSICQRPSTTRSVSAGGHIARATRYSAIGHERKQSWANLT